MVNKLEDCFKRIARAEKGNGKVMKSDDLNEGIKIFREDALKKKKLALFQMDELAQRLFYMNAFKTIDDARKFCKDYSFQHEIQCDDGGILYFERRENLIAVGYSE